jgi:hypothetical protein
MQTGWEEHDMRLKMGVAQRAAAGYWMQARRAPLRARVQL